MKKETVLMLVVPLLLSMGARADEMDDLKAKVEAQDREIDQLKQQFQSLEGRQRESETAVEQTTEKKASWTDKLRIKGDVRVRFEDRQVESMTDNSRMRFRARVGVYTDDAQQMSGGIRVATGSSNGATSANQDFGTWSYQKNAWIDLAYLTYAPVWSNGLQLQIGKIKRPWIDVDTLIWDHDVNPEGLSLVYQTPLGPVDLFAHLGHFIVVEQTSDDVQMTSGQVAGSVDLTERSALRVGGTAYMWRNIRGAKTPGSPSKNYGNGNSTTTDGTDFYYATGFEIGQLFYDLTIKSGLADFTLFGEYLQNFDAIDDQDTAWLLGFGAQRGKLACSYGYRDEQENSILAYFMDSDFAGSQIGRGHRINAKYHFNQYFYLGLNYAIARTYADEKDNTLLFDTVLKF